MANTMNSAAFRTKLLQAREVLCLRSKQDFFSYNYCTVYAEVRSSVAVTKYIIPRVKFELICHLFIILYTTNRHFNDLIMYACRHFVSSFL